MQSSIGPMTSARVHQELIMESQDPSCLTMDGLVDTLLSAPSSSPSPEEEEGHMQRDKGARFREMEELNKGGNAR